MRRLSGNGGGSSGASLPTIAFASAIAQAEGNSGSTVFTFTLTLTRNGSTATIPFTWAVAGSGVSPASAADFVGGVLPSGSGTFAPGETSKAIAVNVAGDSTVEPDEGFTITANVNLPLAAASTTGSILNDDLPTLDLSGPMTYTATGTGGSPAGTLVASVANVPAGATPTISPNDGRLVVAGDATNGWKVVVGMSASTVGTFTLTVSAAGANSAAGTVTVSSALTSLPQASSIAARWSADAIPTQADNTALASWTDAVGGLAVTQGTAAAQPKYRTGGAGGKPFVLFSGAQWMTTGNPSNPIATLLANGSAASTTFVVYRNAQTTQYGWLFAASTTSPWYALAADGANAGFFGTSTAYSSTGALSTICYTKLTPDSSTGRIFVNNSCLGQTGNNTPGSAQDVWIGGIAAIAGTQCKAEIYDVIVWNRALTAAEVMQVEKWARDKYSSAYPWAGAPFRVFHGDSLTSGQAATSASTNYPARVAAANGWTLGHWTNLGHSGAQIEGASGLKADAVKDIDPMVALLGTTPLWLSFFEWYNQRFAPTATATASIQTYVQDRKAAGVAKVVIGSSTDAADPLDQVSARAAYNSWLDANALTFADAYVPIHKPTGQGGANEIGPEGACPNASPYAPYFDDGIHLKDAGYQVLANLFAPKLA